MPMVTKSFVSDNLKPKTTPDGSSLEEQINTFLATLNPKDVLDVEITSALSGKYGQNEQHFGVVVYKT